MEHLPLESMFEGWGVADTTPAIAQAVEELRRNEESLRPIWANVATGHEEARSRFWRLIARGVPEALGWDDGKTSFHDLCERALRYRSASSVGHVERLAMREKARVVQYLSGPQRQPLQRPKDLLALWDEATRLEPLVRLMVDEPRWRMAEDGLPFTNMSRAWLYGPTPLQPGYETADPNDIPTLVSGLVAFLNKSQMPPEVTAAHAQHLLVYIHPFAEGNGHTSRLLTLDLLFRAGYGLPTIAAYVDRFRAERSEWTSLLKATGLGQDSAEALVAFQLHLLREAQGDVGEEG